MVYPVGCQNSLLSVRSPGWCHLPDERGSYSNVYDTALPSSPVQSPESKHRSAGPVRKPIMLCHIYFKMNKLMQSLSAFIES